MPRIKEYIAGETPQQFMNARASGADFGSGTWGAIGQVGQVVSNLGEVLARKQEKDEAFQAELEITKARSRWQEWMTKAQQEAPEGAQDFTKNFNEQFSTYAQETSGRFTTTAAQQRFTLGIEGVRAGLIDNAMRFEATSAATAKVNSVRQVFGEGLNAVRAAPQSWEEAFARDSALIDMLDLPEAATNKMKADRRYEIAGAAIDGSIDTLAAEGNAALAADYLNHLKTTDGWKKDLAPQDYAKALDRLQVLHKQLLHKEQTLALDGVEERIRERETGVANGLSAGEVAVVQDARTRAKLEKRIGLANEIGDAVKAVESVPMTDLVAMVAGDRARLSTPGEFDADTHRAQVRQQAIAARIKAFNDDPASYAMKVAPGVKLAYDRIAAGDASPEALADYAVATKAEQTRLDPTRAPELLPKPYVAAVANQLNLVETTPEGAEEAYNRIAGMAQSWGKHWPDVARQLQDEKVLTGPHAVVARLTSPDRAGTGQTLLRALAIGEKELKKQIDLPNIDREAKASVTAALAPFRDTLTGQVGGDRVYQQHADAVETMALYYVTRGAKSLSEAVGKAANDVILRDYEFRGSYRIPSSVDADAVESGAKFVLRNVEGQSFELPRSLIGLREADAREGAIKALKKNGRWTTNGDETGLTLTWPNGEAVMYKNGNTLEPLTFRWDQLKIFSRPPAVSPDDMGVTPNGDDLFYGAP